jgi:MFS superfamily sulfate permease-like transporter
LCVVVGGYLAFIGYFCLEAGVALCISDTIMKPSDWYLLFDERAIILALPGILAGIALTAVARKCQDEAMLPISMVVIPMIFYVVLFVGGWSISEARDGGWVGETSEPVPVTALYHLVDFEKVQWHLFKDLIPIWLGKFGMCACELPPAPTHFSISFVLFLGMTFVVSFSSCLDVAAISMDMGQALDTNNELMTVGISNCKLLHLAYSSL